MVGCHLWSLLDVGKVGVPYGPCTAAADTFAVRIHGQGGHAAFPHQTIDPIAVAAEAISNLQYVVSRGTPPPDSVVLSVTRICGGTADNVIPQSVEFGGTVRTYRQELRERTRETIGRILNGVTAAHDATFEFDYALGYDAVINDRKLAAIVRAAAGPERLAEFEPLMAGDDFSSYLRLAPGCFFFAGAGDQAAFPHHHPRFTIDERALPVAIDTLTRTALRFLESGRNRASQS